MRGVVASVAFRPRRKFSVIPLPTSMFNRCDLDTEKKPQHTEVCPRQRSTTWNTYTTIHNGNENFLMYVMGSFIYAMVNDHLLDAVASSIRKCPELCSIFPKNRNKLFMRVADLFLKFYKNPVYLTLKEKPILLIPRDSLKLQPYYWPRDDNSLYNQTSERLSHSVCVMQWSCLFPFPISWCAVRI